MFKGKPASGKPCFYCQSEKQVMEITFDGTSNGVYVCLKDFWKMIQARTKNIDEATKTSPTISVVPKTSGPKLEK
ncbi:hypothetical protein [Gimesia panareensis]|uniref:hypothetical protein n=1 Tax=Gimesia panareensis TaxID=2527978 RepID=UPI00118B37C4|nr:hypothetical protein [Gimesia panareensis]QDU52121.1 hypothetical protein Pan110_44930 [Gimesia panareensis]